MIVSEASRSPHLTVRGVDEKSITSDNSEPEPPHLSRRPSSDSLLEFTRVLDEPSAKRPRPLERSSSAAPTLEVVYTLTTVIQRMGEIDLPCDSREKSLFIRFDGDGHARCTASAADAADWTAVPEADLAAYVEFCAMPSSKETMITRPGARRVLIDATKLRICPAPGWCLKCTLPLGDYNKEAVYRHDDFTNFDATAARLLAVASLARSLSAAVRGDAAPAANVAPAADVASKKANVAPVADVASKKQFRRCESSAL